MINLCLKPAAISAVTRPVLDTVIPIHGRKANYIIIIDRIVVLRRLNECAEGSPGRIKRPGFFVPVRKEDIIHNFRNNKMAKLNIQGKELRAIGYPEGPVISIAMNLVNKHYKHQEKKEVLGILKKLLEAPLEYRNDPVLGSIAEQLIPEPASETIDISMNQTGIHFNVFGSEYIEQGAMHQMYAAAKLPISVAGALMPDAHSGYGLPIGGVLATENAVIPYGVGVDIGCRMCLSIFDIHPKELIQREAFFSREILEATLFGSGGQFKEASNHEVMEHEAFGQLGANIANHYTKVAKQKRRLPARRIISHG